MFFNPCPKPIKAKKKSAVNEWEKIKKYILKPLYVSKELYSCELRGELVPHVCTRNMYTGFAHRHSRVWYKNREHLLGSFDQTILACQNGHYEMDNVLRNHEAVFRVLRGAEHGVTFTRTDVAQ